MINLMRTKSDCSNCALNHNYFVPTEYNNSPYVILAEAPGKDEVEQGKPLVGMAGKILMEILTDLGLGRTDFNYLNVCGCRPTIKKEERLSNRTPSLSEIKSCFKGLVYELNIINPVAIIAMGRVPYVALTGKEIKLATVVNTSSFVNGFKVFWTYHPASILYQTDKESYINKIKETIKEAIKC